MYDPFILSNKEFRSRLMLGTGRYSDSQMMRDAIDASGAEIITVAVRRLDLNDKTKSSILDHLDLNRHFLLPNTAGCYSARQAILCAQLARQALKTNWIKLEVIGHEKTLLPDNLELLKAANALIREGFVVLPYCSDDPIVCKKLEEMGCSAVMPLASPIGSGLGIRNEHNLRLIRESVAIPVIVDAGIGTASDATLAMELGVDGLLVNTAIAKAKDPVQMASAMSLACASGRLAFFAGRIQKNHYATASSPKAGRIECARL